jgi:hypothetical protein
MVAADPTMIAMVGAHGEASFNPQKCFFKSNFFLVKYALKQFNTPENIFEASFQYISIISAWFPIFCHEILPPCDVSRCILHLPVSICP